jgi:hypothetical protein
MRLKQRSTLELVGVVAGAIAAVAGAIGGVAALAGGSPPVPKPVPQADLKVARFEPNITRGEFARRYPESAPRALTEREGEAPGGVLALDLGFHNFDGHRCRLTWTMYDDATDVPMRNPALVDQRAGAFDLREPYVHLFPAVWIPAPTRAEAVYEILQLRDGPTPCGSPFQSNTIALE